MSGMVFVFGSNLAGRHGAGAARFAAEYYGAKEKVGEGPSGQSYALPTKDNKIKTLPLNHIKDSVDRFIEYAKINPEVDFMVTRVGCGLAGYKNKQIAELFKDAPGNCHLPGVWQDILQNKKRHIILVADPANLKEKIPPMDGTIFLVQEELVTDRSLYENNPLIMLPLQRDRFGIAAVQARNQNLIWLANQVLHIGNEANNLKTDALESGVDVIKTLPGFIVKEEEVDQQTYNFFDDKPAEKKLNF